MDGMVGQENDPSKTYNNLVLSQDELWRCYNLLLLSPDLSRIRKLLVRYRLFQMSLDVPGDIVECGVFKGVGLMYWAKLLEIFAPNSRKQIIGFDVFGSFKQVSLREEEEEIASQHDQIAEDTSKAAIAAIVEAAGLAHRIELIEGDIAQTASAYVAEHYGRRISLLHLDLDTYAGTKAALTAFWPVVSRGGVFVFDNYALAGMGESQGVDEFFRDIDVRPLAVQYSETPTAYLIKP
jgi:hypothetical protein